MDFSATWGSASTSVGVVCAALSLACLLSCQADPPPPVEAKDTAEAATEKKPAVDEKIANAMAQAQAKAQATSNSSGNQAAPPADGIMSPEHAARELAPGSAAQVVLGGEGASPRLRLGAERIAPGAGPLGKLQLSYRSAGSVMPTVEFDLKPKITAVESPSIAATPGQPASEAPAVADVVAIRFGLSNARLAENQPGRLPDNARSEIAKVNGSWVELISTPRGALQAERTQLAGNNPGLEPLVRGSADALSSIVLPYPDVPVGVGAFWMVKSREKSNGADVLCYRMVKVTEVIGETAKLTVNTRRYLLTNTLPLEGLPPHQVRQFESEGNASMSVRAGAAYPESAELEDSFAALLASSERPNQPLPFQSELSAKLSFGQ